ncbi:MAG: efflux RND transporter periplasmic adaptor subunit [Clostridia bacterium]|nr:efflux RND transporter periplasmic adaptor subunit [Clostridia bacterium]
MVLFGKTVKFSSFSGLLKNNKKKTIIISIIILAILLSIILPKLFIKAKPVVTTATAQVTRGNITQMIEGSGTIEAIDQYEITSLVSGDILEDFFEEGDMIEKDALMYRIDSSDLDNSIKKANLSLERAELSYNNALKSVNDLNIKSDNKGTIKNLYIKEGDKVSQGAKIADVVDNKTMTLSIDFLSSFAKNISVGDTANVELIGSFTETTGVVTSVSTGSMPNEYGVNVTTVEIDVTNPGAILEGDTATATVGEYACNAPGTFSYKKFSTITSESSGTVTEVFVLKNDTVNKGTLLAVLENDSVHDSLKQNSMSLEDARLSLENNNDKLENYNIVAPISGKVIQKNIKAGEKLDNTNTSSPMAIISDLSSLIFTISVDELDISQIELGQKVSITADALEGQKFSGIVDNISIVGTSSNGVTSYPVKVVIDNSEETDLIPGMNVDATIVIASKENVLTVPVSAVNRGNTVTLADGTKKEVTLGLSDSSNVEIISGLNEGDEIVVPVVNFSSDFMSTMMNMHGGMSGGMPPGGMSGGMPSGMSGGASQRGRMSGGARP